MAGAPFASEIGLAGAFAGRTPVTSLAVPPVYSFAGWVSAGRLLFPPLSPPLGLTRLLDLTWVEVRKEFI